MIALIVSSGALATFFGGAAAKILFYSSIIIPLSALIYTFYVYNAFKVYNTIGSKIVVKGEKVPYRFILSNELFIAFTSVKVRFAEGKSRIDNLDISHDFCLLPGKRFDMDTYLTCLYRGEYNVGIDRVIVKDFLGLWEISYASRTTLRMRVCPRILKLTALPFVPDETDMKVSSFSSAQLDSTIDNDVRQYINGDSRHLIHWKATAKSNELMVRKYTHIQKTQIAVFMDTFSLSDEINKKYVIEDCIIESVVAMADYFLRTSKPVSIYTNDQNKFLIKNKQNFDDFYAYCSTVVLKEKKSATEIIEQTYASGSNMYIIVTGNMTKKLAAQCYKLVMSSKEVVVITFNDDKYDISLDARINVININSDEDIKKALSFAERRRA